MSASECPPCAVAGRHGYCARGRCYCGHPECWAYDSWEPPPELTPVARGKRVKLREEPTE